VSRHKKPIEARNLSGINIMQYRMLLPLSCPRMHGARIHQFKLQAFRGHADDLRPLRVAIVTVLY
jgi:hypothetical protein